VNWAELEAAAPEIVRLGKERVEEARVALLGTLRRDGSPRISPVEPFLSQGNLLFGAMSWSSKTRDLQRDPRCVLHSAVTGPDVGEGELKLYGWAAEADDELREAASGGWWLEHPREAARVFGLDIEQAVFVSWDLEQAEVTVKRWSPQHGYRESSRSYP
jgi:pyridoxamine 5'-phosphate oxidase-like protein